MQRKVCAITGHRPQKFPWRRDETDPRCAALKEALREKLESLAEEGYCDFLSGMAEGVDTWAAEMVLELRDKNPALKLHCILPCREQADKWSAAARAKYREILDRADSVVYVNRSSRKTCMLERDRFLVEYADMVLAVYNGEQRGGTAATLRYARREGRKLIVLPVEG